MRQHTQARSISTRLGTLTTDIDSLTRAVNDPHSGLVVTLTTALSSNKSNQQQALDANVLAAATQYLHQCTRDFHVLNDHFRAGRLPAANTACVQLLQALDAAPEPLPSAKATRDLRVRSARASSLQVLILSDTRQHVAAQHPRTIICRPLTLHKCFQGTRFQPDYLRNRTVWV